MTRQKATRTALKMKLSVLGHVLPQRTCGKARAHSWKKENLCLKENNLYLQPLKFPYMRPMLAKKLLVVLIFSAIGFNTRAQNAHRIYVEPDGWGIGLNFGM